MSNDADSEYDNLPIDEAVRRRIDSTKRKRDDVNEETDLDDGETSDDGNRNSDNGENSDGGNISEDGNHNSDNGDNGENSDDEIVYDDCNGDDVDNEDDDENEERNEISNHCTQILNINEQKQGINKQLKIILRSEEKSTNASLALLELFEHHEIEFDNAWHCPKLYEMFLIHNNNLLLVGLLKQRPNLGRTGKEDSKKAFMALSEKLKLNEPSGHSRPVDQTTCYSDYKQIFHKVHSGQVELVKIKSEFKRHWRNKFKSFLTHVYEDRNKHLGKEQRNVSQKGQKKKKGSTTRPTTLLSVVPPVVVPPIVAPVENPPLLVVAPVVVAPLLAVAPLLVPPPAVLASLAVVQGTTIGGVTQAQAIQIRQEQIIETLRTELEDARKKIEELEVELGPLREFYKENNSERND